MSNELTNLQKQIQEALQLIQAESALLPYPQQHANQTLPAAEFGFEEPNSLLDKCAAVCAMYAQEKPTIRIIHHLACTGGTLISKCISVMPNTYLLSEVHPYTDLHVVKKNPQYMPSDLASLSRYAGIPQLNNLQKELFINSISTICNHLQPLGGQLVLRDHTHSDFHTSITPGKPSLVDTLSGHFNIKSVITFRNPIDSYLSLKKNGWLRFSPSTFEEYCARILLMLEVYETVPIFHYESFVENPAETLINICAALSIDYDDTWPGIFDIAQVSGDSGRSDNQISVRPRRELDPETSREILESESFHLICSNFKY